MTKLIWDQDGSHKFGVGVDRGVLYTDTTAVAWNGITSISEVYSSTKVTPIFIDGVKATEIPGFESTDAALQAITYPDEFAKYDGIDEIQPGLFVDDQMAGTFDLCYRTKLGNDIKGADLGYQIHILYNLTAVPTTRKYETLGGSINPIEFSWELHALPEWLVGYWPSSHVIIDSTLIDPALLSDIEAILYGTGAIVPSCPTLDALYTILYTFSGIVITDNGDGTWTAVGPSAVVGLLDANTFQITASRAAYITDIEYQISSSAV